MSTTNQLLSKLASATLCALVGLSCTAQPQGLAPTQAGAGPVVKFDLLVRPLPEIPFPNDLATRLDLDSPTGPRINASVVAPTTLEGEVRQEMNALDGWGTFGAITVSFDADVDAPAIRAAHLDDDFANDAVYLVNLKTGEPVALDLGRGNFPVVLQDTNKFFLNDPRDTSSTLMYETQAETNLNGNGVLDLSEDTDHDGVWDQPNTTGPDIYKDLLDFYEKQTHTLVIRPVVTLEQRTTYAVVLTRRIKDAQGRPLRSPFPFVNHLAQTDQLRPLLGYLGKGKLAGLSKDDLAFAWTFTTQSTTRDLEAIREGLYGDGPLAWLGDHNPPRLEPVGYADDKTGAVSPRPMHPLKGKAPVGEDPAAWAKNPYVVPMDKFGGAFDKLLPLLGIDAGIDAVYLADGYKFVDYFVIGSFRSPDFIDDNERPTIDGTFRMNAAAGLAHLWERPDGWQALEEQALQAGFDAPIAAATAALRNRAQRATRDRVWFMLTVPKALNGHQAPFPVALYGHGYTSQRTEMLGFAGNMAKQGIATAAIDSYGHGLGVSESDRKVIEAIIASTGFGPTVKAIMKGRARDLDNDGIPDSGGDFWVADTFHTRDVVRQSIVDWMQFIRVMRNFGTYEMGDINGDGIADVAGDFNGDGVPDVGGPDKRDGRANPGSDFFVFGQSLGGILAAILPAVEPKVVAAAPIAGGAGLGDVGIRSEQGGVIQAVFLEILGPILASEPAGPGKAHLVFNVQDVNREARVRLTDTPLDLAPGDRVSAWNTNTKQGEPQKRDEAIVDAQGRFRLQVAMDNASFNEDSPVDDQPVHLGLCDPEMPAQAGRLKLRHGADCIVFKRVRAGAPDLVIDTFPADVTFQKRKFAKGTPLVALARGFALKRGAPEFRRFFGLAQTILEAGDPASYAPHYTQDLLPARAGNPAGVLVVATTGDLNVPVNTGYSIARVAGAVPYVYDPVKHAAWGRSPNDVLIQSKATECLEKLRYFRPVAACMRSADPAHCAPPADLRDQALLDLVQCVRPEDCERDSLADPGNYAFDPATGKFLDEGNTHFDNPGVPRLKHGLRDVLVMEADAKDGDGNPLKRKTALITPYLERRGKHGFDTPHPSDNFDIDLYMINMVARFFETRGTEIRYDLCMHRDGYDAPRLIGDGVVNPDARRVPACDFIPPYPQ